MSTMADPWPRWLHDADRVGIQGTRDLDGGEGLTPGRCSRPRRAARTTSRRTGWKGEVAAEDRTGVGGDSRPLTLSEIYPGS